MTIDVFIDKLMPCLVEVATGKVLQTTFSLVSREDISGLAAKGWLFDWTNGELDVCINNMKASAAICSRLPSNSLLPMDLADIYSLTRRIRIW